MKLKRSLATGAAIVIVGFSLTACGDDGGNGSGSGGDAAADSGDSPDDASTEDFCAVWNDDSLGGGADDSADEQADAAHEAADKLAEVGTPEDIEEDARNGFKVFVEFLSEVDGDDISKFADADPTDQGAFADTLGIEEDEAEDVIAFITYAAQSCIPSMEDLPSDIPTDIPTEQPSE